MDIISFPAIEPKKRFSPPILTHEGFLEMVKFQVT
jgi:hypothetical protein